MEVLPFQNRSQARGSSAVQNTGESKGIGIDLSLRELNPNHKYRMALMGPPPAYWLAELSVVKADESLYLMPLFQHASTLTLADSTGHEVRHQVLLAQRCRRMLPRLPSQRRSRSRMTDIPRSDIVRMCLHITTPPKGPIPMSPSP